MKTQLGSAPMQATAGTVQTVSGSVTTATPVNNTAAACAAASITTGGTAVTFVSGATKGGYITNPPTAAGQGLTTSENLYVDMVASPGSTDANGNGTTVILVPGQTFTWPALGSATIKANAATSTHKATCEAW